MAQLLIKAGLRGGDVETHSIPTRATPPPGFQTRAWDENGPDSMAWRDHTLVVACQERG